MHRRDTVSPNAYSIVVAPMRSELLKQMRNITSGADSNFLAALFPPNSLGNCLFGRLTLRNLRYAFYLISPYESTYETIEEVPQYDVQVSTWWMIFILLEFVIVNLTGRGDRFALNDSVTCISAGILSQCFKFGGKAIAIFPYIYLWDNFRIYELPWDSIWTWILCLFAQDFMYYLGHRAIHEIGFFWGFHSIHHSSEYFNPSTAFRQAAIQDAGLAFYDCLQAFFIPPSIFLVHRYFSEIYQFAMHSSLVGDLGPLGIVLNTPSHHRVHHGRNPYCIDKNYGGVFIIWDKMFCTFEAERLEDKPIYGLVENENSFNQLWLQFYKFKAYFWDKGQLKDAIGRPLFPTFADKVRAALYPPGWFPGINDKVHLFFHWYTLDDTTKAIPSIEKRLVRYDPILPGWLKIYCCSHFVIVIWAFMHFQLDRADMSYYEFTKQFMFFVATMQCVGAFFDKRWFAPYMEITRCSTVIVYFTSLLFWGDEFPLHYALLLLTFVGSVSLWISRLVKDRSYNAKIAARENLVKSLML
ncbi:hypothetical protein QR680_008256 [Steinernema hermaphroditum]|uniref:Alkylglycerol monooxygenase n=1 Tax=Steinernema hermaphroditum TaxID=289476 RepID=A0AA39IFZ7_9BILA|nr:hypothetical protein QR680_008256 [Steinernema hermaphroditum]